MAITWQQMTGAVADAQETIRIADSRVNKMAHMISGKLRSADVTPHALRQLKRELKNFNMQTSEWKK